MPKISVIMGMYNSSLKIKSAIESILNQTFSDFELIICDDGSTDNSYEIVEKIAAFDKRIKLIKNPSNVGLAATLNNCIKLSRGVYIARMDDDDISKKNRFEVQANFLDTNLEYSIVGSSRHFYDDDGIWGHAIRQGERTKFDIYMGRTFVHPSVMMRKDALLKVGCYSTGSDIGRTEDFDLWCKLYYEGFRGYNLKEILLDYYEARESYGKRKYKYRICEYKLKKKWRKKLRIPKRYAIFSYRPLIVGLLPVKVLMKHHTKLFGNVNS